MIHEKYQEKCKKQDKRKKEKVFWRARESLALFTLFLILPNCNTGISFHDVVQNIFNFLRLEFDISQKHEMPFHYYERVFINLKYLIKSRQKILRMYELIL